MDWKPKVTCMEVDVDACTGPGLPSMVHSRGAEREHRQQGTGGVGKKWGTCKCQQMAGIEIDKSQSGGTEVWETGTVNFPPPLSYL